MLAMRCLNVVQVSKQEVLVPAQPSNGQRQGPLEAREPRVFSLQKLVEVADFNMTSRSRLVWANVWEVSSPPP